MGYMNEADRRLDELLKDLPGDQVADVKKTIKAKLLESYRNEQKTTAGKTTDIATA